MRHTRLLASILSIALAALSVGVATAWYSDSAAINYQISAASDFGDEPDEKVWVCKLIGPPDDPQVKEGKNPIHVSVNSIHAEEGFSDAHPSYVVEHGNVECSVSEKHAVDRNSREEEQVESPPISPSTSTSTTSTSSTTTTSTTTTTTTSTTSTSTPSTTTTTPTTSSTSTTSTTDPDTTDG